MPPTSRARRRDARALAALGLAAGITVPAALLGGPQAAALPAAALPAASAPASAPAPASLAADRQPVCGDPDAKDFPIETRIQGAPDRYASGGGYGTWFLDLTNTTGTTCRALHPVLVLADRDRRLTSDQIQLEFSEPGRPGVEHRVTWESTDRDEQIGVFGGERDDRREKAEGGEEGEAGTSTGAGTDTGTGTGADGSGDGFLGFTVPAGETVSVRVRMAFTSDTDPGPVTAHAAVVQRRHQDKAKGGGREDGEWVGESEDYAFVIVDGATGGIREPEQPRSEQPRSEQPRSERPQSERPQSERPRSERPQTERPRAESPDPERADPEYVGPGRVDPGDGTRTDPGTGREPSPDRDPAPRPPTRPGTGEKGRGADEEHPGLPPRVGPGRPLPELARTGPASLSWTGAAAGALLLGGAALVRYAHRARRTTD
ncbi:MULTISPECIES: peptidase [Streptomyces]|uniref:peptidase n=1 Tax=Streptomyces TaxID=1883 RepID=UPI00093EC707|nr:MULTISPECIES: peptidase [unclassified Streptomyces]OKJ12299.1 peptidase [Streptomyces sp. TSRI0261]QNQ36290.1 peptidase [Streptomyces sp. CB00271]